jgi:hypothetical protein
MKATELYEKLIEDKVKVKADVDIIHVNDGDSRLFGGRFNEDFAHLCPFYDTLCTFNHISMTSPMFINLYSKLAITKETVVILDNIKNPAVFDVLQKMKFSSFQNTVGDTVLDTAYNKDDSEQVSAEKEAKNDAIRKINFRIIYLLDELVWDGVGGRGKSIYEARVIEDFLQVADTIIVPTSELRHALIDIGFVAEERKNDITILPFTIPPQIYQVYAVNTARTYSSVISKPKILVKGAVIPTNVCEFIVAKHKKYNFTICSGADLPNDLMLLLANGDVRHIVHYSSPSVNYKNITHTYLDERDGRYDFVIHCNNSLNYDLASGDIDPMLSVACGSIAFACVRKDWFTPETHLCEKTGTTFTPQATYNQIDNMISHACVAVEWNKLYDEQRGSIEVKISDKAVSMARIFAVLIGKDMVKKRFSVGDENGTDNGTDNTTDNGNAEA